MSNKLNLDQARKARAEKRGPAPVVVLDDVEYTLPASPPALAFVILAEVQDGDLRRLPRALELLFGEDNAEALLEAGLDMDDLEDMLELYEFGEDGLGEGSTSGDSSSKSSGRSRPASKGRTAST